MHILEEFGSRALRRRPKKITAAPGPGGGSGRSAQRRPSASAASAASASAAPAASSASASSASAASPKEKVTAARCSRRGGQRRQLRQRQRRQRQRRRKKERKGHIRSVFGHSCRMMVFLQILVLKVFVVGAVFLNQRTDRKRKWTRTCEASPPEVGPCTAAGCPIPSGGRAAE